MEDVPEEPVLNAKASAHTSSHGSKYSPQSESSKKSGGGIPKRSAIAQRVWERHLRKISQSGVGKLPHTRAALFEDLPDWVPAGSPKVYATLVAQVDPPVLVT